MLGRVAPSPPALEGAAEGNVSNSLLAVPGDEQPDTMSLETWLQRVAKQECEAACALGILEPIRLLVEVVLHTV